MAALHVLLTLGSLYCLAAVVFPFRPFRKRGQAFGSFIVLLFATVMIDRRGAGNATTADDKAANPISDEKPAAASKEPVASNWEYSEDKDQMTDVVSKYACTTSSNRLTFNFPYSGGSTGELCLRQRSSKVAAYVSIHPGQFLCGFETCRLRLKFDDNPIKSFEALETGDHRSDTLFIEPASSLLQSLIGAKQLKLEATFFQEGSQVLIFDVSGLDWKKKVH